MCEISGKAVLVREDLNVPMKDDLVTDDTRLRASVPTVNERSERCAKVLILAHFVRPKGLVNPDMSLAQTVSALSSVLGRPVTFIPDCQGEEAKAAIARLGNGDIALLENTRFHAGEEKNDPVLIEAMAALGDPYVNAAFSSTQRAYVSTAAPAPQ